MSNIQLTYTTKLESVVHDSDVCAILDAKLEATSPAQLTDYVGLALDHITAKRTDIKAAIKQLQELDKHEANREEFIKEQCANWLEATGLDKLDGLIVSSMTINNTKPKENLIVTDEDACINAGYFKTVMDTSAVKKALLDGVEVEGAHIEVVHVANKIKVNKKRNTKQGEE